MAAKWDAAQLDGPRGAVRAEVVIVDADHLGERLAEVAAAWRAMPSMPGVMAIGRSEAARDAAPTARVTLITATAKLTTLIAAIRDTAAYRLAAEMRWPQLRAALGLSPSVDMRPVWAATLAAARATDIEIPRAALRWY